MWGNPREGTEAHRVKQLVEEKKKLAKTKKFDSLFCEVYFEILKHYSAWNEDKFNNGNKEYVHPDVEILTESGEDSRKVKFKKNTNVYEINESTQRSLEFSENRFCDIDLYLNEKKVFGISVEVEYGMYGTSQSASSIHAYVNDDWVTDFIEMKNHHDKVIKEREIRWAEDSVRTQKLKDEFGIDTSPNQPSTASKTNDTPKSSTGVKWLVWGFIAFIVLGYLM